MRTSGFFTGHEKFGCFKVHIFDVIVLDTTIVTVGRT